MQITTVDETLSANASTVLSRDPRAIRILAKTIYRDLCTSGYDKAQVVAFTSELLDLVTSEMRDNQS